MSLLFVRMGAFERDLPASATRIIGATLEAFEALADVQLGLPLWKIAPTFSRKYRRMEDNFNIMADYIAVRYVGLGHSFTSIPFE